jgi:hypothetical protein
MAVRGDVTESGTENTSWLKDARFGIFIHWGLYAVPARHEWVKSRERIRDEEYDADFAHFEPDLYDPALWAREAAKAGRSTIYSSISPILATFTPKYGAARVARTGVHRSSSPRSASYSPGW